MNPRAGRFRCGMPLALALLVVGGPSTAAPAAGPGLGQLPQKWLDDERRETPLAGLVGRRVVLTMAYVDCHRICPTTIARLERLQQQLDARGEPAEFVVVGYDPKNDTPAAWHRFRASRRLQRSNWHFLSGSTGDTSLLARQLGFGFWKYDDHVVHDLRVVVFDAHGVVTRQIGPDNRDWLAVL